MTQAIKISVAKGDGIGPEIMDAVLRIFDAAKVTLDYEFIEMGKTYFEQGFGTGMTPAAKESVERNGILFKGPMETPKGKGMKSINVTARKTWSTYANRRHFQTLPGVDTVRHVPPSFHCIVPPTGLAGGVPPSVYSVPEPPPDITLPSGLVTLIVFGA